MKITRQQLRTIISEVYGKLPDDLNLSVAMKIKDMMPAEEAANMQDDDLHGLITTVFDREFDTTGEGWNLYPEDVEEIRDHLTVRDY